jgi:16S rRNA (cytosine1402-N4)-methyltransferase
MERKTTSDASDPVYHVPVLLREAVEGLSIKPDGVYVDCTLGGGGHGRAILERLGPKGRLIAFDQDADAVRNLPADSRVQFWPQNFRHLRRFLRLSDIDRVDGVLADLGVSSHQFDEGGRGFSIRFEGPLDMRMDQRQPVTAAEVVAKFSEAELHRMFERYGEVTNAKTLARHLVAKRQHVSIDTTQALKDVIRGKSQQVFRPGFSGLAYGGQRRSARAHGAARAIARCTPTRRAGRDHHFPFYRRQAGETFLSSGFFSGARPQSLCAHRSGFAFRGHHPKAH